MGLRVHQIEIANMHLPRFFPALPIHPATMGTWIKTWESAKILRAVMKLSKKGEPAFVWLIEGGGIGPILVDTGIPDLAVTNAWYAPNIKWKQAPHQRLEEALPARTGVSIEEVRVVVQTHIHFDHSGRNGLFPGRKIIAQKKDIEAARRQVSGVVGSHPFDVGYHESCLEGVEWDAREGDYEICPGVRAIATPGHTPGSQTILVDTDEGTVGLAGDLFYSSFSMPEKMLGEKGFKRFGLKPYRCHGKLIFEPHGPALKRIEEKRLYESERFGYYVTPVFDSPEELLASMARVDRECDVVLVAHNALAREVRTVG